MKTSQITPLLGINLLVAEVCANSSCKNIPAQSVTNLESS